MAYASQTALICRVHQAVYGKVCGRGNTSQGRCRKRSYIQIAHKHADAIIGSHCLTTSFPRSPSRPISKEDSFDKFSLLAKRSPQRIEETGHVLLPRRMAHQADAPDFTGERSEPAADLDLELTPQPLPDSQFIDPLRTKHRVQHGQAVWRVHQHLESHSFQP